MPPRRNFPTFHVLAVLCLASCKPAAPDAGAVERIDLDAAAEQTPNGDLPNAVGAAWSLATDGKSLRFANPSGQPLLSLACDLPPGTRARIRLIQHASAPPGAKALFALAGNGMVARIDMDARREGDGWLWEGSQPAAWPKLDVLTGAHEIVATMPGGGEFTLPPSPLPQQLIAWCRGQGPQPTSSPSPSPAPSPTLSPA
jgi:hypothetical protein